MVHGLTFREVRDERQPGRSNHCSHPEGRRIFLANAKMVEGYSKSSIYQVPKYDACIVPGVRVVRPGVAPLADRLMVLSRTWMPQEGDLERLNRPAQQHCLPPASSPSRRSLPKSIRSSVVATYFIRWAASMSS